MELSQVLDDLRVLDARGVRYAVLGGLATAAHGLDRGTRDLALSIAAEEDNVAALCAALDDVFNDADIAQITPEGLLGDYPAIQYAPPILTTRSTS